MTSPFQTMGSSIPGGPKITPATANSTQRGGQQNPPYLQMRRPVAPGATQPVVTPAASMAGDTVAKPPMSPPAPVANGSMPPITPAGQSARPLPTSGPSITPAGVKPPQQGGTDLGGVYSFMKSDLQNQAKQAESGAIADASARGVYYGTPLTGSEADIHTQLLRGEGQLDAGMYGNEQQNQLARLGMATNLSAQNAINNPGAPAPMDWSGLGALFGAGNSQAPNASGSAPRQGPVITPPNQPKPPYATAGTEY